MKQKIIPIIAVVVGVLAFALTHQYLKGEQAKIDAAMKELYAGARKIYVVGAKTDIPAGSRIEIKDLTLLHMYESAAPDRVVREDDGKLIVGKTAAFHIKQANPILWSDIKGGEVGSRGLAPSITTGMRAISLGIGGTAAVSSMVRPNDRVDVLGTFSLPVSGRPGEFESVTLTVLQDVTVLATGQEIAKDLGGGASRRRSGYSSVTLEVTPQEAELLVFAEQSRGKLTLALRNPSDVSSIEGKLPSVNFEHIQSKLEDYNRYRQEKIRRRRPSRSSSSSSRR